MEGESQLLGLSEVAALLAVSKQVIVNWRQRQEDFPAAIADLKSGPVWQLGQIAAWAQEKDMPIYVENLGKEEADIVEDGAQAPRTVALANMKGGVGKSTLAANLGWYCAQRKKKNVLLVDLDPQFNLSQYVMGPDTYERHINDGKRTVWDILEQVTPAEVSGTPKERLTPDRVIANIRKFYGGGTLDLIPSRLELAWTLNHPYGKEHLLADFLEPVRSDYDLVLIDCPPTESMLTTSAYLASDWVLVPVRPEFLSTIGLPLLVKSLEDFRQTYRKKSIDVLGIVFNASGDKQEHDRSRQFVRDVAARSGWYVFEHEVTYSDSYAKGSRAGRPIFQTDYARWWKVGAFVAVAEEFVLRIGL